MTTPSLVIERVLSRVNKDESPGGCWTWTGHKVRNGYGRIRVDRDGLALVHRVTYEHYKGAVPLGMVLDHLCRNRACCNPDHLEAVTTRENIMRGVGLAAQNAAKTHCPVGHEYTAVQERGGTTRRCRECKRAYDRERYLAKQASA